MVKVVFCAWMTPMTWLMGVFALLLGAQNPAAAEQSIGPPMTPLAALSLVGFLVGSTSWGRQWLLGTVFWTLLGKGSLKTGSEA